MIAVVANSCHLYSDKKPEDVFMLNKANVNWMTFRCSIQTVIIESVKRKMRISWCNPFLIQLSSRKEKEEEEEEKKSESVCLTKCIFFSCH